jgi:hypothetical protein
VQPGRAGLVIGLTSAVDAVRLDGNEKTTALLQEQLGIQANDTGGKSVVAPKLDLNGMKTGRAYRA